MNNEQLVMTLNLYYNLINLKIAGNMSKEDALLLAQVTRVLNRYYSLCEQALTDVGERTNDE